MISRQRNLKWGVALLVLSYSLLLFSALSSPGHVRAHPEDAMMFSPFSSLWAVTLTSALAIVELMIATGPLLRAERWAFSAQVVPIVVVALPRILTDPRCITTVMTQHGCHTYMISVALAVIGLALAAPAVFFPTSSAAQ